MHPDIKHVRYSDFDKSKGQFLVTVEENIINCFKIELCGSSIRKLLNHAVIQLSPLRRCNNVCLCLKVNHSLKLIHTGNLLLNIQGTGLKNFLNTDFSFNMSMCLCRGKKSVMTYSTSIIVEHRTLLGIRRPEP